MVKSPSAIHLGPARAENQEISTPGSPRGFVEQTLSIVRADRALETVKQQETRRARPGAHSVKLDKVTIRGVPPLEHRWRRRLASEQLSPEGLQVAAGNPPGRRIDYFPPYRLRSGAGSFRHFTRTRSSELEVQIFGIKKSADTRKALRFFSERRIKTHFVDLLERPAALGELRRFAQKFGVMALVDKESKRFDELGLRYAQLSDDRWLEKLAMEPLLLRIPLVRNANQLVIGADEDTWKSWIGR
jgi:arsenate reductase-like glutaredoxin family protein